MDAHHRRPSTLTLRPTLRTHNLASSQPFRLYAGRPLRSLERYLPASRAYPVRMSRWDRCLLSGELTQKSKAALVAEREAYPVGSIEEIGLGLSAQALKWSQGEADAISPCTYEELEERFLILRTMRLPPLRDEEAADSRNEEDDLNEMWRVKDTLQPETEECISMFQEMRDKVHADSVTYLDNASEIVQGRIDIKPTLQRRVLRSINDRKALLRLERHKADLTAYIIENLETQDNEARQAFLEDHFEYRKFTDAFESLLHNFLDPEISLDSTVSPYPRIYGRCQKQNSRDVTRSGHIYYNTRGPVTKKESDSQKESWYDHELGIEFTAAGCWCPITKVYHIAGNLEIAQVVPFYLSNRLAAQAFNTLSKRGEERVLWNVRNTLPVSRVIQALFDKHMVTFASESSTEFRFIVLHPAAAKETILAPGPDSILTEVTVGSFHNTLLEWKNDHRPDPRFLFWHFLFSLKRLRASGAPGWQIHNDMIKLDVTGFEIDYRKTWVSPEGFMSRGLLKVISQLDGFSDLPPEFHAWLDSFAFEEVDNAETLEGEEYLLALASEFAVEQRVADRKVEEAGLED